MAKGRQLSMLWCFEGLFGQLHAQGAALFLNSFRFAYSLRADHTLSLAHVQPEEVLKLAELSFCVLLKVLREMVVANN